MVPRVGLVRRALNPTLDLRGIVWTAPDRTDRRADFGYTARLEDDLDRIARGEVAWEKTVTDASFAVLDLAQRAGLRGNPLAG